MLKSRILKHAVAVAMIASALGVTGLGTTGASAVTSAHAATTSRPAAVAATMATTVEAAAAPANCPLHCLCGYVSPNWVGSISAGTEGCLKGSNEDLNVPGDVWNNVASIYNNGATDNVNVYRGEDYSSDGGHMVCLYRQTGFLNMQSQLPGLYHHIWSNQWISSPCL